MTGTISDKVEIHDLLCRFFQSFDDLDWEVMRSCLCDEVNVDYSSFRNVPAGIVSRDHYVEQRRSVLGGLDMQPIFSTCVLSFLVVEWRRRVATILFIVFFLIMTETVFFIPVVIMIFSQGRLAMNGGFPVSPRYCFATGAIRKFMAPLAVRIPRNELEAARFFSEPA